MNNGDGAQTVKHSSGADIFIGTSGWHYDDWKGVLYPEGLARSKWLSCYGARFNTVEVNATFYRTFGDAVFSKWGAQVPCGFRFVFKAPRLITHRKYLRGADGEIREFCRQASLLGDRLGLVLMQLAPSTPVDPQRLETVLASFRGCRVAVEFRNDRWLTPETRSLLEKTGAIFCTVDSPEMRINDWVTADIGYIRLHGRSEWYSHRYSDAELRDIAGHARAMISGGARTMYIFFNNDCNGYAVENAVMLNKLLAE